MNSRNRNRPYRLLRLAGAAAIISITTTACGVIPLGHDSAAEQIRSMNTRVSGGSADLGVDDAGPPPPTTTTTTSPRSSRPAPDYERSGYSTPPPGSVIGPDPSGETCDGGMRLNKSYGQPPDRIYTHSSRAHARTSCELAENTLDALWTKYPQFEYRGAIRLKVEGSVSCSSTGASTCDADSGGYLFVMRCTGHMGEGPNKSLLSCEGGVNGRVYIY
jgi:hypothetical protein